MIATTTTALLATLCIVPTQFPETRPEARDRSAAAIRDSHQTTTHQQPKAWPAESGQPFGLQWYPGTNGPVFVETKRDALAIRAPRDSDLDRLSVEVERALVAVSKEAPTTMNGPVRRLTADGLFLIEFNGELTGEEIMSLATKIELLPSVLTFPVLARAQGRAFSDNRLIVIAQTGKLDEVLSKVLAKTGGRLLRKSTLPSTALVEVGAATNNSALLASQRLMQAGIEGLEVAEPQLYRELALLHATDPAFGEQWHLSRSLPAAAAVPGLGQINVEAAWEVTEGSSDVTVAIFDSGIEYTHPDLAPNMVQGFDVVDGDGDPAPSCSPFANNTEPSNSCPANAPFRDAHGTSVSGIIAAVANNDIGGTGVCPACRLLPVRFLSAGATPTLTTAEAFVRAVNEGAAVINNSWGPGGSIYFPVSNAVASAFSYARANGRAGLGTVIVFASGNESNDVNLHAYAAHPETLAVSASTNLDDFALYSNYGSGIDIVAPSRGGTVEEDSFGLVCTDVTGPDGYESGDLTRNFGGTSGAAPVLAGVAALVISAQPSLTADQVRLALTGSAAKITADQVDWLSVIGQDLSSILAYDEAGHSVGFGYGRVDASAAITLASEIGAVGGACSDDEACAACDELSRCLGACSAQADCLDGSLCESGVCTLPRFLPDAIGAPCSSTCAFCVVAADTDFEVVDVCTDRCEAQSDCPAGFDCRLFDASGLKICAVGDTEAGEPYDVLDCNNAFYGSRIVAEGDDGQRYCTDVCFAAGPGACPFGFHCGPASCECALQGPHGCVLFECNENSFGNTNWPTPMCFPDPGYGVTCSDDLGCTLGDYCGQDGLCRTDDRDGCAICKPCSNNNDCGERGICFGDDEDEGEIGVCTRACANDSDCGGDAVCRLIDIGFIETLLCTAPGTLPQDAICRDDFTCEVTCRDDVPCPTGEVCEESICVPAPYTRGVVVYRPWPEAEIDPSTDAPTLSGCRCLAAPAPGAWAGALALGALMVGGRRRAHQSPRARETS